MDTLITTVLLTHNEEQNLPRCLESLAGLCSEIFVVDSGSTDQTAAIAERFGAHLVSHPFETAAKQWNWALQNLPIQSDWVLALDADHRVTPELKEEILRVIPQAPLEIHGFYIPRKQIFRGRWIRHGGYWPKYLLKLFRRGSVESDERESLDFRFYVKGQTRLLRHTLLEQNQKEQEITFWLRKHLHFIELHAQEEYLRRHSRVGWAIRPSPWRTPDQQSLWFRTIWYRMPLYVRPFLYFGYRYFLRLGFLDGAQGTLFHFLQGFWFWLMVDVRLGELNRARPKESGNR